MPFTHDQFLEVFAAYNNAIWPAQIVAALLGLVVLAHVMRPSRASQVIVLGALALMWIWTGIAYHWVFFARINPAAYGFSLLFVAQAVGLTYVAFSRRQLHFAFDSGIAAWFGLAFIIYAAVLYPLIGLWAGLTYPGMPLFGITPCPVTIFTFGILLLATRPVPRWLLAIPVVWSLVGGSAAFLLNIPQDWLLLASGGLTVLLLLRRDHVMPIASGA